MYRTYQIAFKRNNPTILSRASIPLLPAEWEALYTPGPRKWLSTGTTTQLCFASQDDRVNGYANQYPAQSSQEHDRGKVRVITSLQRKYWYFTKDGHLMLCSIMLVSTWNAAIMRFYVYNRSTKARQRCDTWNFCSNLWTNTKFWLKIGSKQILTLCIKTYLCFCAHLRHKILNTECSFYCVSEDSRLRPGKPAYVGTPHDKFHIHRQGRTERVLLEKLRAPQLCTKFPAFYGLRKSITVLTTACNLYMSWAR